ncbi:hypothetical protein COCHEDRAFT_1030641 [Bipolaris maydis C5]|uniref:BZIP domain-containing protein n=1 Tax=Cochliobolus heterostrophus (strain C5 / ATCC 48332 / race O) TaxID=701091 RepID=M2TWJ3_COCH5|nr:hypothetical protein COCHEDRAFT_1030641 [Bipolaris maydis C5]KAH7560010.1 hypothetical protein BM1_03644 [Bipolaris maydis]KAJ6193270.1 hypothetical protein J3E72DRAFT_16098 [Bipolaris maydis]KAJ6205333.1 hypothetical protein PSV09DRAFT_1030641 [Bipolaris maydis]KAJ6267859.1 hypothetical protein PSV08DRAFT_10767 [Bipolaris maydis]
MEKDYTSKTDAKEKKRIQNRIAQRVHREKLKSRIRELEQQLELVTSASAKNDTSKPWPSCGDSISTCAVPGVLTTTIFEAVSDESGTSSSDITFVGDHAPKSLSGSETAVESGANTISPSSIIAQLDTLPQTSVESQCIDLEWLLSDSWPSKTASERTTDALLLIERGSKFLEHNPGPLDTSSPQHLGSPGYIQASTSNGHLSHKMMTVPTVKNHGHEALRRSGGTELERLSLLVECSRRLGFNDLNEALSVYYTSDLSGSAVLSHEQSLNRVKQLPNLLSKIREHSKQWPAWERANYVRETLTSAEEVYAEECRLASISSANQGIGLTSKEFQVGRTVQITRALQQEVCSALLASTDTRNTDTSFLN